ncbi:hypothetical protein GLU26_01495 [Nanohaloarchaea archaeon]|nr:hypothetical protein [Candidatus Nanohaloarchaea archaeon]
MKYIKETLENSRDEKNNLKEEIKGFNNFLSSIQEQEPEGTEYVQVFYENVWEPTEYSDINRDKSIPTKRDIVENFLIEYEDVGKAILNREEERTDFTNQGSLGGGYKQPMKQKTVVLIDERESALQNLDRLIEHLENSYNELRSIESSVKSVDADVENWADFESAWNRLDSSSDKLSNYLEQHQYSGYSYDRDLMKLVGEDTDYPVMSDIGLLNMNIEEKKSSSIQRLPVETA